jgi:hypothetical protein
MPNECQKHWMKMDSKSEKQGGKNKNSSKELSILTKY